MTVSSELQHRVDEKRTGFRPRRLAHANMHVDDADAVNRFYHDVVGFEEVYRRPGVDGIFLSNGNTYHDLALLGNRIHSADPGLNHLAFELENELDLISGYKHALEHGMDFQSTSSHDVAHSLYASDPDGNGIEIYADVKNEWRKIRSGVIKVVEPDWVPGSTPPVAEQLYPVDPEIDVVSEAFFHPARTASAVLVADRFEEMYTFYTDRVGLSPLSGGQESAFAVLGGTLGHPDLALFRSTPWRSAGLHHVGFQVLDDADLDASISRAADGASSFISEIDHPARHAVMIEDPCGTRLQFFYDEGSFVDCLSGLDPDLALFLV